MSSALAKLTNARSDFQLQKAFILLPLEKQVIGVTLVNAESHRDAILTILKTFSSSDLMVNGTTL